MWKLFRQTIIIFFAFLAFFLVDLITDNGFLALMTGLGTILLIMEERLYKLEDWAKDKKGFLNDK